MSKSHIGVENYQQIGMNLLQFVQMTMDCVWIERAWETWIKTTRNKKIKLNSYTGYSVLKRLFRDSWKSLKITRAFLFLLYEREQKQRKSINELGNNLNRTSKEKNSVCSIFSGIIRKSKRIWYI